MPVVEILYLEIYLFYIEIFMVSKYIYGLKLKICRKHKFTVYNSSSQSQAMKQFHYKALQGKVSINYVDKISMMLTLCHFGPMVIL